MDALSRIGLVAAQGSSTQPSVCAESWGSLSIFLRVSRRQLLEYQQLLKHCSLWERPWSASWDRSPACGLLHRNRGTDCFQGASCARRWSTCHCWPAWKRGPPAEYWVASWERGTDCLALGGHDRNGGGSFFLLLRVRLEDLFLCLSCTVAFTVSFPVAVIDSHR